MTKDMTTGNAWKSIIFFSLPVLVGNLFQQFYNMADAIIVGQFLGEDALAAVGATGSIMFLVLGFAMGIAQGFGVLISHAFGAKDENLLKHYVATSLVLGLVISLIMTVITVSQSRNLLLLMNTPENILDMSNDYIIIIYSGITATMAFNITSAILRGVGDSRTPLFFLLLSSGLNIILDIVFILVFKCGPEGAAYATVIAQGVSALLCFIYMFWRVDMLKIRRKDFYFDFKSIRSMLVIGIPMSINYSVTAIGGMILQSAVNVFGSTVLAAYTAATKVDGLATQSLVALGTTMSTYCGQNLGAGNHRHIFDGMKKTFRLVLAASLLASFITIFLGKYIVGWFLSDTSAEVLQYSTTYLNIVSCFYFPLGLIFLYRNALQGLNEPFIPMMSGLFELICRALVVWLCVKPFGYTAVCLASPAAWIGAGIPLLITYFFWKRKIYRQYPNLKNPENA